MTFESYDEFGGSKIIVDYLKKIKKMFLKMGLKYSDDVNCNLSSDYQAIVEEIKDLLSFCRFDKTLSYQTIQSVFLFYAHHFHNTDSNLIEYNFKNWFQNSYIEKDKSFSSLVHQGIVTKIKNNIDELKIIYRLNPSETLQNEIDRLGDFLATLNKDETSPGDIKK